MKNNKKDAKLELKNDIPISTRRFKALSGFKNHLSIIDKIAVYDSAGNQIDCCVIQKDDNGRECYYPTNLNDKYGLFTDKPKDAIECIKAGYGDAFQQSDFFGLMVNNVVRYLDREYGERLREKTLKGWKDTKFAYGIKFSYTSSFSDGRLVMQNKALMGFNDDPKNVLSFDRKEDALLFIKEVNEKAAKYYEEYCLLKRTKDHDWDYKHTFRPFFEQIEGRPENGMNSVYWNAFYGLCEEKKNNNPEYEMAVIQIVK